MTTILPSAYLPSRVYFSAIKNTSEIIIDIHETFPKQTIRNRSFILSANGVLKLSIPLASRKNNTLTKDIQVDYSYSWQKQHIRALESAYNSSAFFLYYKDELFELLCSKKKFLLDYNTSITNWLLNKLKIESTIAYSDTFRTEYPTGNFNDYRSLLSYKQYQEPVIAEANYNRYFQTFSDKFDFHPNLSVLDLLFNEGNNTINLL